MTIAFPRSVRYSTIVRLIFPVVLVSLLVVIFAIVMWDLAVTLTQELNGTAVQQHDQSEQITDQIKSLIIEKHALEATARECRAEKSREIFETTNYLREENEKLDKKIKVYELLERRRRQQIIPHSVTNNPDLLDETNNRRVTVDREFFNYLTANLRDTPYPGADNYTRYAVGRLGLTPLVDVNPLIPGYGPVINDVLSFRYPISVPPCFDISMGKGNRTVFVAVNSATDNFDKRNIIRQTWKNHLTDVDRENLLRIAGFAFILGQTEDKETQIQIEEEANTYGDIIQIEMADVYDNLPLKVVALFNWLYKNCFRVDFVLKVDDDVYVNVRNLAHFVQAHYLSNQSMFGLTSPSPDFWPQRDGKWGISFEDWPWDNYPPSYNGPVVLFPGSVILSILATFQTTPTIRFEDIYYTGICREKAGLKIHLYTNSTINSSVATMEMPSVPTPCDLRRFVAWVVNFENEFEIRMNNSHLATDDFYRNVTQCIVNDTNGNSRPVNPSDPVQFHFIDMS